MTSPRKPTPGQRRLLQRITADTVYVYRDPARPGSGITQATLTAVSSAGWVVLGDYQPLKGRPLALTDAGRALLDPAEEGQ
ncbi:hypothetical protein [Planomonospora algeriensis]